MVTISMSDAAEVEIRRLFVELGNYEEPATPFLLVHWAKREVESRRGGDGQAVWEEINAAHWAAEVAGWASLKGKEIEQHAVYIRGLPVLLDNRAETSAGKLFIHLVNGRLTVLEQAP